VHKFIELVKNLLTILEEENLTFVLWVGRVLDNIDVAVVVKLTLSTRIILTAAAYALATF